MLHLVQHIRKRLRELPRDAKNRNAARDVLTNARSLLEVVQTAGYKLDAAETKSFKDIPPLIDAALRGAIRDSIEPSNRSHISFDIAYLAEGSGHSLTISAPKRTGEVQVVLQAPMPRGVSVRSRKARGGRPKPAARRSTVRKRRSR